MKRNIIKIHEEKCVGCGLCVSACQEGAIQLVDGKAKLVSESYCDGLGNCLPSCPTDAIEIVEREAQSFDKEAADKHKEKLAKKTANHSKSSEKLACGCPGHEAKTFDRSVSIDTTPIKPSIKKEESNKSFSMESQLMQWPIQMRLISPTAPYLENADLLIAADCTAFAYGNFHNEFIKDKITIIACPKLDNNNDNIEKLKEILTYNTINSVTVVRMEVPCCTGIVTAVKEAMLSTQTIVKYDEVTISTKGEKL